MIGCKEIDFDFGDCAVEKCVEFCSNKFAEVGDDCSDENGE